ncbi:class F sortase [Nonomuraea sp. NPDC050556]|uniref:class F sortase n=1 Tax=Nonomuraea sp. NPDC050556 TaxID=3364369 RepID=UPI0037AE5EF2
MRRIAALLAGLLVVAALAVPASAASSAPVSLTIPAIGVQTSLVQLGQNADGTIEVPALSDVMKAGWYRYGSVPGRPGPAVIVGHVDTYRGPAVFFRLGELRKGDTVTVKGGDGKDVAFTVDSVEQVDKDRFPTSKVYDPTPDAQLRLITCGGEFNQSTRHYEDNIIVYAHSGR